MNQKLSGLFGDWKFNLMWQHFVLFQWSLVHFRTVARKSSIGELYVCR